MKEDIQEVEAREDESFGCGERGHAGDVCTKCVEKPLWRPLMGKPKAEEVLFEKNQFVY